MATEKYAVEAILTDAVMLKHLVEGFKDLVKDCNLDLNESGIQIQSTDSSNVALIHVMMRESAFESYRCHSPITVGINMESVGKVLKMCQNSDKVTIRVEMDKRTTFTFESTEDDRRADFDLKIIELEQEALGVPETEYEAVVKIPSNELKKAVADLRDCGDIIGMHASSEGLKLEVAGDIGTGLILLRPNDSTDEEEKIEVKGENDVCLGFGMRYIYLFTKASGLCKSCTLNLKNGEPMSLIYNLGEESHGHLKFVLAPKLSED